MNAKIQDMPDSSGYWWMLDGAIKSSWMMTYVEYDLGEFWLTLCPTRSRYHRPQPGKWVKCEPPRDDV